MTKSHNLDEETREFYVEVSIHVGDPVTTPMGARRSSYRVRRFQIPIKPILEFTGPMSIDALTDLVLDNIFVGRAHNG